MTMKKNYIFLLLNLLFISFSYSATCTSTGTGNWSSASTWSCGHVPTCGDNITIASGTTVTVDVQVDLSACASFTLTINGTLTFNSGNKLALPAGSVIIISSTGSIVPGTGGGSSNLITINGTTVYSSGLGTITGPVTVTETTPLPIELVSFTALKDKDKIALKWITASEINNDFFTVEKSSDGINYTIVQNIDGSGTTPVSHTYLTFDYSPTNGLAYYRLKQTDFDGHSTFSGLVYVDFYGNQKPFSFVAFPNPSDGNSIKLSIESEQAETVILSVCDVVGKEYFSKTILTEENGNSLLNINFMGYLTSGIYSITAKSKDGKLLGSSKMIVK